MSGSPQKRSAALTCASAVVGRPFGGLPLSIRYGLSAWPAVRQRARKVAVSSQRASSQPATFGRLEEALACRVVQPDPGVRVDALAQRAEHPRRDDHRRLRHPRAEVERRMAQDRLQQRADLPRLPVLLLERARRRTVGRHGHEVAPELAHEEGGVRRILEAEVTGVLPVEGALLAEDQLEAEVVPGPVVAEVRGADAALPLVAEPGQRPRLLADVLLGIAVLRAEGEQLHQLARVVLVRRAPAVLRAVQPEEHRRVRGDVQQQLPEVPERVAAEQRVLAEHQLLRADPVERGGEPVVPDERHALDERPARARHSVEPPEVVVTPRVPRGEPSALGVLRRGPGHALAGRAGQGQDGAVEPELRERPGLTRARAEAGAPEQALRLGRPERTTVRGDGGDGRIFAT